MALKETDLGSGKNLLKETQKASFRIVLKEDLAEGLKYGISYLRKNGAVHLESDKKELEDGSAEILVTGSQEEIRYGRILARILQLKKPLQETRIILHEALQKLSIDNLYQRRLNASNLEFGLEVETF